MCGHFYRICFLLDSKVARLHNAAGVEKWPWEEMKYKAGRLLTKEYWPVFESPKDWEKKDINPSVLVFIIYLYVLKPLRLNIGIQFYLSILLHL